MSRPNCIGYPLLILMAFASCFADEPETSQDPLELFESRIMPIFRSEKPSSCVQCHLSSVDLKNYILPSHTETFVALREAGLVELDQPNESKILSLIQMGEQDADLGAQRIHAKARQAEYQAFAAWIHACCADPELRALKTRQTETPIGPAKPIAVIRHSRKDRVIDSFTRNVWSQRMRCFPCHTPHEIDANNPKHKLPAKRHREFVAKYGAKMNLFDSTPQQTMARWIASSRRENSKAYPLIHLQDPARSLILLKPTAKLPPKKADGSFEKPASIGAVSHMGGLKMHPHDQSYKAFVAWLQDYSAIMEGRYQDITDLPSDDWIPTKRVLRIRDIPEDWGQHVVQLFVYQKLANGQWSEQPIAFTQNTITPRRMVNGALIALRSAGGEKKLVPGPFLVKVFVDRHNGLHQNPAAMLDEESLIGQAEIDAQWEVGFPNAETVSATHFK
ncbi:MAG: hypothetical protein ACPGLY_16405 [Rubripirellula sp.]